MERFERIKLIGEIGGIVGVIISLIGMILSVNSLVNETTRVAELANARRIEEWQQMIVFDIIRKHDTAQGVSFVTLSDKYALAGIKDVPADIPRERLTESQLKKVLLNLVARRAIEPIGPDSYTILSTSRLPDPRLLMQEMQQKMASVVEIVKRESGRYDRSGLMDVLSQALGIDRKIADFLLLELESHPKLRLEKNSEGKLLLKELP